MADRRDGIVMIVDGQFPTPSGGAESQVSTLGEKLIDLGHPVHVLAVRRGEPRQVDRLGRLVIVRISTLKRRFLAGLSLALGTLAFLWRHRRRYAAIHVHRAGYLAAVATLVGAVTRAEVLIKVTGYTDMVEGPLNGDRKDPISRLLRLIFRAADFQATAGAIERRLLQLGYQHDRIHRIPNAVDTERFHVASEEREANRIRTAVYVGRLETVKGVRELIEAWHQAMRDQTTRLLIAGNGTLEAELEERIRTLDMDDRIELLGPVSDIPDLLANADFAVLPSHAEGLSNSLLEYMAAGLPVLGTRVSGTEDLIERGINGWLVEPRDADMLASRLSEIPGLDDEELRAMGQRARRRVVGYASIDAVVAELHESYGFTAGWRQPCAG